MNPIHVPDKEAVCSGFALAEVAYHERGLDVFTLPSVGAANADHSLAHLAPHTHTRSSRESATNTLLHAYHRSNITPAAVLKGQSTDAIE
jgi:hypothetical protein